MGAYDDGGFTRAKSAAEAAGIKDPTPSRLIDKGKGREAAEAVTAEYKAYEDRERAARARDAERAAKRNK